MNSRASSTVEAPQHAGGQHKLSWIQGTGGDKGFALLPGIFQQCEIKLKTRINLVDEKEVNEGYKPKTVLQENNVKHMINRSIISNIFHSKVDYNILCTSVIDKMA